MKFLQWIKQFLSALTRRGCQYSTGLLYVTINIAVLGSEMPFSKASGSQFFLEQLCSYTTLQDLSAPRHFLLNEDSLWKAIMKLQFIAQW